MPHAIPQTHSTFYPHHSWTRSESKIYALLSKLSVIRYYKYSLIECVSKYDRVLLLYHTALVALIKVYDSSQVYPEAILVN